MRLSAIHLRHFRNFKDVSLNFTPGINYIYGANAQGKTNLLEAIYLLITGRSFRTHQLSDLIHFDADHFFIEAHFEKHGVEQTLKMQFDEKGRKIIHNATPITNLSALLGILHGVILSPEDHELLKGGPANRRHFLDLQIAQTHPIYLHHLGRYVKSLKQRNALLRRHDLDTIDIWEEQMAQSAAFLTSHRLATTQELSDSLETIDPISLRYKSQALAHVEADHELLRTYFLNQYAKQRDREKEIGATLTGPHRDELEILLEERPARLFASEGQQRFSVASLRLAEWARLQTLTEEPPILCIDDVGISLDLDRIATLYQKLAELGQVFLTSPRLDPHLPADTALIQIEAGEFSLIQHV